MTGFSSPHQHSGQHSSHLMLWVIAACLPGFLSQIYWFGYGVLFNVISACIFGLLLEALIIKLRQRPLTPYLLDGSALVTCLLLGLSLPGTVPWWLVAVATVTSIGLAKHLYGGLGNNPFNPAMVGYAACLIAFPTHMTLWPNVDMQLSLGQQWQWFWSQNGNYIGAVDAYTQATPLDVYKHLQGQTISEVQQLNSSLLHYTYAQYWISGSYLIGGFILLLRRIITWHAPVAMLASLGLMSLIFSEADLSANVGMHLTLGATVFAAFFIITDPVSSATSRQGKLIFGAAIGLLIYIIRTWGSYPDAVAFAVLLLNLAAPLIDEYIRPKAYGQ